VIATTSLLYARNGLDARGRHFHALFQFQLMGLNGAFLAGDLFNLFVFFEVTAIGLVGYQPFTDGNDRVHWRARVIWQAVPDYGLNLQMRWRQYTSGKDDVEGAYFNPDRYRQWQGVVGFRRRLGAWVWTGALGAGRETINGSDTHPVRMAELRAEGALTDKVRLAWHASYNRSTGYVESPDYAYREVGVTLIYPF
jgi:hypothetical protein